MPSTECPDKKCGRSFHYKSGSTPFDALKRRLAHIRSSHPHLAAAMRASKKRRSQSSDSSTSSPPAPSASRVRSRSPGGSSPDVHLATASGAVRCWCGLIHVLEY